MHTVGSDLSLKKQKSNSIYQKHGLQAISIDDGTKAPPDDMVKRIDSMHT